MITDTLAQFIVAPHVVPEATVRMMQLSMFDWMACGIAGIGEPVSQITREMALDEAGRPEAHVFGSDQRIPARAAALVNGTTSHALDYDDTHFAHIGHPSVAVLPAALAVAEPLGASRETLLHAALIGVETAIRVGIWLGRDHYQIGFHQTGTAGAFGAAAAAARLLGFDASQTAATLGLTATRASGLKSQFGTMGKPYNAGIAAANGVEAARLVARGFIPNPMALESAQGFGPTHAGLAQEQAMQGLGTTWRFDTISHKFHACCHGLHATLEALATLNPPPPEAIQFIEIMTHPRWMSVCNQPNPTTGLGAKFSYRMVTAMALTGHDTAALNSYTDALCADPTLTALRARVSVSENATLSETQAVVRITLKDGTALDAAHDLNTPMPLATRQDKLMTKAAALIGADRSSTLWTAIQSAKTAQDLAKALF